MFDIQEELKKLPGKPGVYIMHDAERYDHLCGKSDQPENRVRQYFQTAEISG